MLRTLRFASLDRGLVCFALVACVAASVHAQGKLQGFIKKAKEAAAAAQPPTPKQPPPGQPQPPPAPQGAAPSALTDDSVELTQQMYSLMTLRDIPQFMDDRFIVALTSAQVSSEQSFWKQIGPQQTGGNVYPAKPSVTYEWQKLIDSQPEFAGGPMLEAFVNNTADWSFLTKNPLWNPNANMVVGLTVFSKEKVDGRQAEFAARELTPVAKRMLQMAMKKLPTHFFFSEQLPLWKYDFTTSTIRFNATAEMPDRIDLMRPVYDPSIKVGVRDYYDKLPAKARELVAYAANGSGDSYGYSIAQHTMPNGNKPGGTNPSGGPEWRWKQNFVYGLIPEPTIFALDRQVRIGGVPLDVARAEALTKQQGLLTARVFFTADRMELGNPAAPTLDRATQTVLYAKLDKVQILDRNGSLVATLDATSFRTAKEANAALAAPARPAAPAAAAPAQPAGETNEQRVKREQAEAIAKGKAEGEAAMKQVNCESDAERVGTPSSAAYKKAYATCMAKKP